MAALLLAVGSAGVAHGQPVQVGDIDQERIETAHPYQPTATGEAAWRYVVRRPYASYIALHFESFDLAAGDSVVISHPGGLRQVVYTGKGKDNRGTFWATHIPGDTAIVELLAVSAAPGFGFAIDQVAHGYPAQPPSGGSSRSPGEDICGDDDSLWAQCYSSSQPGAYDHGRAVARLLINGASACTGWLIGSEGHLITNNHCIDDAGDAADTDFEFLAEGSCATDCSAWFACPGTVVASSATLVRTSDRCNLDYALVQLPVDPTPTYGYLTLDSGGTVAGEQIYIVGHPAGWGKRISLASTDPADAGGVCTVDSITESRCDPSDTCGGVFGGPLEVGYMCDTQGGSSGSPVLRYSNHQVVALHHCKDCPNRGERIQDVITDMGADLPLSAVARGDKMGSALAACDFNGDGRLDLAIGVPDEDVGALEDAGLVNVLYGTAAGLQASAPDDQAWTQNSSLGGGAVEGGSEAGDRFGAALAAGDFNNDGFCDLAIGVPGESIGATLEGGYVNVLYGSAAGLQTVAPADQGWYQDSRGVEGVSEAGDHFGAALAVADFNNDLYDDVAIGVPGEGIGSAEDAGYVNVLYGGAAGLQVAAPADQGWSQDSGGVEGAAETGDHFGAALAAGDFNNDGNADLAVGVPDEDVGAVVDAGYVNVLYGGAARLQTAAPADQGWSQNASLGGGAVEDSSETGDHFGKALAAGDFDNDGRDDLAIGVPEENVGAVADAGMVNVLYGGAAGLQTLAPADQAWHQDTAGVDGTAEQSDGFGSALAAGDFDNNGKDDLAIGVPEEDIGAIVDAGYVTVLYGAAGGLQTAAPADQGWDQDAPDVDGTVEAGDHLGRALAAGDFDNNGKDDLAIGVPEEDIGAVVDAGYVAVLYGVAGGLQATAPADDGWSQDSSGIKDISE